MSDKELLEMSAKAVGMWTTDFSLNDDYKPDFNMEKGFRLAWGKGWWNPLTDDGDALRLAVKLDMTVIVTAKSSISVCVGIKGFLDEEINGDIYAATRRAIVRAAAEIGANVK
jgi:hypothetical protein